MCNIMAHATAESVMREKDFPLLHVERTDLSCAIPHIRDEWMDSLAKYLGERHNFTPLAGGVAQLGERCVRNAEVGSSILLLSTTRISTGRFNRAFRFCRYAVLKPTYSPNSRGASS